MLFVVASLLLVVSIAALLFSGAGGVLITLLATPIIAAGYEYTLGGLRVLQILGTAFPIIIVLRSFTSEYRLSQVPLFGIWATYIIYNILTFSFVALSSSMAGWVDLTLRLLNGLAGYFAMQAYFVERSKFKVLLLVLIWAGAFPMIVGVYQIFTGVVWRYDVTVGMIRNVGLYHDAVVIRLFAFQTLAAIVLYMAYFAPKGVLSLKKVLLLGYMLVVLVVLYRAYSKAATLIVVLWFLIWMISFRRILPTVILLMVGAAVAAIYYQEIAADVARLFSKELVVAESEDVDAWTFRRTLGGRVFSWYGALEHFSERSLFAQVFGDGNPANIHNDFLAKLLSGGIVGLLIYVGLVSAIGIRVFGNWRRHREPLDVMALMVFVMIVVDSMGIHVTMYTSYQWFAWGIIGLALRGLAPEAKSAAKVTPQTPMRAIMQRRWQSS